VATSLQDQYKLWQNRIDAGKKCLDDDAKDWKKYECAYEGEILRPEQSDFSEHLYSVNLQYVDVRSSTPKFYSQNPYLYIDPKTPEADLNAEIMEKVVNGKLDDWNLKARMDSLIKSCKLKGRAYLKTSYKFDKDKIGREYVGDEPNDEISIQFVSRENLIIDPNAPSFEQRRWAAHRIKAPIADIRVKFKLKETDQPSVEEEKELTEKLPQEEKEDFQFGTYYEIENLQDRTLAIIVEGVDRWAVKPYKHPYKYYSMYDALEWNEIPGRLDTKADLHFWWKQLIELAESKTQQVNHRRKLNAKYKKIGGKQLTDEQINKLTSYKDSIVVELDAGQDVIPFQHATIGQEAYLGEQSTRQDLTVISGMNEMKQGLPQVQKTAREAMAIVAESQDVLGYRTGKIEEVIKKVIEKCIWLIQKFYDATRVMDLTGMEEVEFLGFKDKYNSEKNDRLLGNFRRPFLKFVGTELVGKMRVKVKAGSSMPPNEAQRKQDLSELFSIAAQNQVVMQAIDPKEALKELAKILHVENKGIIIDPKSPEQENSLLKRNIPVMPHMNEPHDDHLATHLRENNNTPAFIMHIFAHHVLKSFVQRTQPAETGPTSRPSGNEELSQENISGMPQGSSVPPSALPQQPGAEAFSSAPQSVAPPKGMLPN